MASVIVLINTTTIIITYTYNSENINKNNTSYNNGNNNTDNKNKNNDNYMKSPVSSTKRSPLAASKLPCRGRRPFPNSWSLQLATAVRRVLSGSNLLFPKNRGPIWYMDHSTCFYWEFPKIRGSHMVHYKGCSTRGGALSMGGLGLF